MTCAAKQHPHLQLPQPSLTPQETSEAVWARFLHCRVLRYRWQVSGVARFARMGQQVGHSHWQE